MSVVTPVHNEEELLGECIESVLAQTYDHWEYVVMNNASTDRSLEIAEKYAKKDPRIRVQSTDRCLDVYGSQNAAFRQVSPGSKYCKMVHGDDWMFPDCLRQMVELAEAHPTVGIVGSYRLEGSEVCPNGLPYPSTVVSGRDVCRMRLLRAVNLFGSTSAHLFRSEDVRRRGNFLDEHDFHGDAGVCFEILGAAEFGFVHQVLMYVRQRPGRLTDWSEAMYTLLIGQLRHLKRYGPMYLERAELEECLRRKQAEYYRVLGRNLLRRRGREFWEYHRKACEELGESLSWGRIVGAAAVEGVRVVREPGGAVRRVAGLLRGRR